MAPYDPNPERRRIAIEQCLQVLKSTPDAPTALAQLRERERESTCLEERVEILGEVTFQLLKAKCYEDALQSSMEIEHLGSSQEYVVGKLAGAVLHFTAWTAGWISQVRSESESEQGHESVTGYFKQAFHLCLEVVRMESFCKYDRWIIELFVSAALKFTLYNHILIRLQEFKECLIWYFSRLEKWESALDFIQRSLPQGAPGCEKAKVYFRLGRLIIQAKKAKALNSATDLFRASGQFWLTELKFELASMSYWEAVYAAIFSKDLKKAELILVEALETTQLRNGEWFRESHSQPRNESSHTLWNALYFLANQYKTAEKFSDATNLLNKGLTLAGLVENEERRRYLVVHIEWRLGQLSGSNCCKFDVDYLRAALENLGGAPNTTLRDPSLAEWTGLMMKVRKSLGRRAFRQQQYQEAYEHFEFYSQLCKDSKRQLKSKALAASAQFYSGARKEGLETIEEVVAAFKNDSHLQRDMSSLAEMLLLYSLLLKHNGDTVKRFEVTQEAISVLCKPKFLKSEFLRLGAPEELKALFWMAKDLTHSTDFILLIDPALSSSREASRRSDWHRLMARFYIQMRDTEEAQNRMELYLEGTLQPEVDDRNDIYGSMNASERISVVEIGEPVGNVEPTVRERFETLLDIADTCTDPEEQQNKLEEAKTLAQKKWGKFSIVGYVSLKLAYIYETRGLFQLAEEETQFAIEVFEAALKEDDPLRSSFVGQSYMRKASILAKKGYTVGSMELLDESGDWLARARPLVGHRGWWPLLHASHKVARNMIEDRPDIVQDSILDLVNMHVKDEFRFPPSMESLWTESLGKSLPLYRQMELAANKKGNYTEALLWSERGRTRWFMSTSAGQAGASHASKLADFDKNNTKAEDQIKSIVEECGSNVAIIEYSYWEGAGGLPGLLYIYVIYLQKGDLKVHSIPVHLLEDLKAKWNKNLEAFVDLVRAVISRKTEEGDKQAKECLGYLHDILRFRYIMDHLLPSGCDTIVFVPHMDLSLLPLHALYDNFRGEYLIQQIRVCYTPSLRLLGRCFELQQIHKTLRRSKGLECAFVAGNPHPMGCGMDELPGAELEAVEVAQILGVQPCVREQMTKEAVVQGLCGSSIVLLATHAQCRPGAIVLQGVDHQYDTPENDDNITENDDIISEITENDDTISEITENDDIRNEEMLSADEMSKLGISAALVVLDGCETGLGKVKSEGVIGLGRSVLQAGASTVVLSLWRVHDLTTRTLVTGMFRNGLDGQRTVAHSLRTSMLSMLHDRNIYHWAPLIAVGSPTLCISDLISDVEGIVDTVSSNTTTQSTINRQELDDVQVAEISSQASKSNVEDWSSFLSLPRPVVHDRVCCDGCDTGPITGLRFKARASYKEDYDLCSDCFANSGCTLDQFLCIVWPKLDLTLAQRANCLRESCVRGAKCHCIKKKVYGDNSSLMWREKMLKNGQELMSTSS